MTFPAPASARRSVKPNDELCQGLRAGGKPVPIPHQVRGRLFRHHALMGKRGRRLVRSGDTLDSDTDASGVVNNASGECRPPPMAGTKNEGKRFHTDLEGNVGGRHAFDVPALRDLHCKHADVSRHLPRLSRLARARRTIGRRPFATPLTGREVSIGLGRARPGHIFFSRQLTRRAPARRELCGATRFDQLGRRRAEGGGGRIRGAVMFVFHPKRRRVQRENAARANYGSEMLARVFLFYSRIASG